MIHHSTYRQVATTLLSILCGVWLTLPVPGARHEPPQQAQVSVLETWRGMPPVPWYQPDTGELSVVPFSIREEPPQPGGWRIHRPLQRGDSAAEASRESLPIGTWLTRAGMLLSLFVITVVVVRTLRRTGVPRPQSPPPPATGYATTVERLPPELHADAADYLARSQQAADQGHFGEAVACLFAHTLMALDRRQLIHWEPGKTNNVYVRELQSHPAVQQAFIQVRQAFEDYFFGGREIDGSRYATCRQWLEQYLQT